MTGPVLVPSLKVERTLWQQGLARVAGVDEVGMGCIGGPVVSAAVVIPPNVRRIPGVRDSKTLPPAQREALAKRIRRQALAWGVGAASVAEIERLNILHASRLAMCRALGKLGGHDHALIDGRRILGLPLGPHTTIVDGDATSYAIACASILAKVTRDHLMRLLSARYPGYGWEHNFGYSTPAHKKALSALGPTAFHRRAYAPVRAKLEELEGLPLALPEVASARTLDGWPTRLMRDREWLREDEEYPAFVRLRLGVQAGELVLQAPDGCACSQDQALASCRGDASCLYAVADDAHTATLAARWLLNWPDAPAGMVVASHDIQVLAAARRVAPLVPRAVRFQEGARLAGMLVACRYAGASLAELDLDSVSQELVDGLHAAGLRVISPHADRAEARDFAQMGVDIVYSNAASIGDVHPEAQLALAF